MSHAHKPQISPCVPGLEAPCHLPAGEAFSSGERQVGECLGRLEQSSTWAGRPGAGVLGSGSSSRLWGSPSLQGQGARGPGGRGARVALRVPQGLSEVRAWAAACFVCLLPTRKRPLGWQGPSGEGPGARPGVSPRFRRGGGLQLRCSWISRHPPLAPDPSPFHGVLSPACPGRPCEGGACWSAWVGCPGAEPCVGWGPEGRGSRVPGLRSGGGVPFAAERLQRPAWASSSRSLFVSTPPSLSCLPHACHLPICPVRASGPRGPCRGPGGASRSDTRTGRTRRRPPLPWPWQVGVTLLTSPRVQAPRQLP